MTAPQFQPDRRLAAILAADVAGYSRLMGQDEMGTITVLKAHLKAVLEPRISARGGRIVKTTGDGLLAEFQSAVQAVDCAAMIQEEMSQRNATIESERRIEFRIGINLGEILLDGGDIFGDAVNIAARLEGIAEPGGLAISGKVFEQVRSRSDLHWESLGQRRLKNIAQPVEVFRLSTGRPSKPLEPATLVLPQRPSIAVLPFENMTGDPAQQYFAEGMSEDIITELSRFRALFVIARNSSFVYDPRKVDLAGVGRTLGVQYVLTGSVRRSSESLRISVQLSEAESGRSLWATRRDCGVGDIFRVQDELTQAIVAALPGHMEADWLARTRRKRPENFVAYDFTLKAWDLLYTQGGNQHATIRSLVKQALALEPGYAQAQALLGFSWMLAWFRNHDPNALDAADRESGRGVLLDPDDAWCHFVRGYVLLYQRRFDESERHYERAVSLNPNDSNILSEMGALQIYLGETEAGIDWIRQAMRLNPYRNSWHWHDLGFAFLLARRYAEAIEAFKKVSPPLPFDDNYLAVCYAKLGDIETAKEYARRMMAAQPGVTIASSAANEPFYETADLDAFLDGMRLAGFPEE
jgi:adenylate cyclase